MKKINNKDILLTFFFILIAGLGKSQTIPCGEYKDARGFENHYLSIIDDSTFSYSFSSCTGGLYGKGRYILLNSNLILHFDGKEKDTNDYTPKIFRTNNFADSAYLSIRMFDVKRTKFLDDLSLRSIGRFTHWGNANDTVLSHSINKSDLPIEIEVSGFATPRIKLTIDSVGRYDIMIPTKLIFNKEIDNGTNMEFTVNYNNRNKLILKNKSTLEIFTLIKKSKQGIKLK